MKFGTKQKRPTTIEKLDISEESLTKLKNMILSPKINHWQKELAIKKTAGGLCARCGNVDSDSVPTQLATY